MKRIFIFPILILLLLLTTQTADAGRRQDVLGVATPASEVNFPPVTSGPGYILPNSPLFLLDQTFQTLRIIMHTDPLARARLHASIAGERLAELRIMFEQDDTDGIERSLNLLTKEMNQAALKLSEAKAKGEDHEEVQTLAGELNEQLKEQRRILATLEEQTQDSLQLRVATAKQQLREAKLSVEDSLPQETLEREIEEGMREDLEESTTDAKESVASLQKDLETLRLQLEMSQIRHLEAREQAITNAINSKEAQLKSRGVDPHKAEADKAAARQAEVEDAMKEAEETEARIEEIRKIVEEATKLGAETPTPRE